MLDVVRFDTRTCLPVQSDNSHTHPVFCLFTLSKAIIWQRSWQPPFQPSSPWRTERGASRTFRCWHELTCFCWQRRACGVAFCGDGSRWWDVGSWVTCRKSCPFSWFHDERRTCEHHPSFCRERRSWWCCFGVWHQDGWVFRRWWHLRCPSRLSWQHGGRWQRGRSRWCSHGLTFSFFHRSG
jgi:hypothetical protein